MLRELKYSILIVVTALFAVHDLSAQRVVERRTESSELRRDQMHIRYRVAKWNIDPHYMNNTDSLAHIVDWIDGVKRDSTVELVSVEFCGAVSPEGSVRFNRWLSNARLQTLERYVRSRIKIPENIIVRNDHYIAWSELYDMVAKSNYANKEDILAIISSENRSKGEVLDSRIGDLKRLDNGVTWRKLFRDYFIHMRNAYTVLVTKRKIVNVEYMEQQEGLQVKPLSFPGPLMDVTAPHFTSPLVEAVAQAEPEKRYMYVKTNATSLALLQANIGVEFDMGRYLSFYLPVTYSALDYFSPTVKFRTFALQPELRVWPLKNQDKLFIGAHLGFAYYNYAFNGTYRYQDRDGTSPTLGGGLSLGYRLPISRNKNWKLEFALGVGAYPLDYDLFINEVNGPLHESRKKTYIGLDNALIGISYRIPIKTVHPKK
ncbi:MAG: DUF3575 domain-containing protein [Alistipes sp.]|nr:DUF3575 domain-containing protein [Alistipes sp.]